MTLPPGGIGDDFYCWTVRLFFGDRADLQQPNREHCQQSGERSGAYCDHAHDTLRGIVEADETFVLSSRKGERNLDRKARKRGGKASKRGLSDEQIPVLVAADRSGATVSAVLPTVSAAHLQAVLQPILDPDALLVTDGCTSYPPCAAAMGISHESLNQTAGERVRGELHIQTVNSRHERLKTFLRRHRGIATKYLDSYLRWFHLAVLPRHPTPRAVLAAAAGIRDKSHIGLVIFRDSLPPLPRKIVIIITHFIILTFGVGMVWFGMDMVTSTWTHTIPTLGVPTGLSYLPFPLYGVLFILFSLEHILLTFFNRADS